MKKISCILNFVACIAFSCMAVVATFGVSFPPTMIAGCALWAFGACCFDASERQAKALGWADQ